MRMTSRIPLVCAALAVLTSCTVKDIDQPPLAGPSTFAHNITMTASSDTLTMGGPSVDISIVSKSPTGTSEQIPVRAQVFVDGVAQDYGTLSAKEMITPATLRYTPPAASHIATVQQSTTVSIRVTPTSSGDFRSEFARTIDLRVVPQGVILPTNPNLVASFTSSPASPQSFQIVTFDASATTNGTTACGSACTYSWSFGDGDSGSGITTTHVYRTVAPFTVTLVVTDARGAQAVTSRVISIANPSQPSGTFTTSPSTNIATNVEVFFNASSVQWAGRNIVRYDWNFGDGRELGSGVTTTHRFTSAGSFTVVLTLTDDLGAQEELTQTVTVSTLGGATAVLRSSTAAPRVNTRVVFDATGSAPSGGANIVSYRFIYGDGVEEVSDNPIQSHTYTSTGTFTATVVITDSNGKTATSSIALTVGS